METSNETKANRFLKREIRDIDTLFNIMDGTSSKTFQDKKEIVKKNLDAQILHIFTQCTKKPQENEDSFHLKVLPSTLGENAGTSEIICIYF
jgi:hypothetical protein